MKKISILIKSEQDFNKVKKIVPELHLDFNEVYLSRPTSVVFKDTSKSVYGVGSIGCSINQQNNGFVIIDTNFNVVKL